MKGQIIVSEPLWRRLCLTDEDVLQRFAGLPVAVSPLLVGEVAILCGEELVREYQELIASLRGAGD